MDTTLTLFFNHLGQPWLDPVVLCLTRPWAWLPVYILILVVLIRQMRTGEAKPVTWILRLLVVLFGVAVCILIADQVSSHICKPFFHRLRPTHEPSLAGIVRIVGDYRGGLYGFFSSHAANTCAVAVYFARIIRRRWISIVLALYVIVNCWTRLYLGVHYVSDILAGLVFGALTGYVISLLVRKYHFFSHA